MKLLRACFFVLFCLYASGTFASELQVVSPDGNLVVKVNVTDKITYNLSFKGKELIKPSIISMTVNGNAVLGEKPEVISSDVKEINVVLKPVIKVKNANVPDHYNMLRINFKNNFSLVLRAYNDGAAYRFITSFNDRIKVNSENVEFNFADDYDILFPEEESFFTHMERIYLRKKISQIDSNKFSSVPALIDCGNNIKIAVTEADLFDYPGFYLTHTDTPLKLKCIFPGYPQEVKQTSDRDVPVTKYADYLAETDGTREFPWRVIVVTDNDTKLLSSEIIYKLASPSKITDTDWIKPGKVAWDWWNFWNISGVDFRAGVNTETYKYYIDFASAHGIEYIILDEGWYKLGDLFEHNPDVDLKEIIRHGKEKNVGIILWVVWKTLDDQFEKALDEFAKMGVKGIKVDFMQRDDQWMVQYYEKVAREAAKRKLLVDFHGAYKPTGLIRTYPNVITSEGVRGNEWNKWSDYINPEHTLDIAFIRMLAGPMDFTPGAMLNGTKDNFRAVNTLPMSQGTRCRQLAMYVIYESPLQMLCDNPTNYLKEQECLDFLSKVPTVWDTTVVLDAKVSDYIVLARRSGTDWYVGAMTDTSSRDMSIDFSFLGSGTYKMEYYQDGINSDRYASDYKKIVSDVSAGDKIKIKMATGGGWAARIYK